MANNADLANVLPALITAIASMQPPAAPAGPAPLLDMTNLLTSSVRQVPLPSLPPPALLMLLGIAWPINSLHYHCPLHPCH